MTWQELANEHGDAAQYLMDRNGGVHFRSVCSRAYYSAYSLITSKLPSGMSFGQYKNPDHGNLPKYVDNIANLDTGRRLKIKMALRRLRQRREDADYRPSVLVDRGSAIAALRDAEEIRQLFREERT